MNSDSTDSIDPSIFTSPYNRTIDQTRKSALNMLEIGHRGRLIIYTQHRRKILEAINALDFIVDQDPTYRMSIYWARVHLINQLLDYTKIIETVTEELNHGQENV